MKVFLYCVMLLMIAALTIALLTSLKLFVALAFIASLLCLLFAQIIEHRDFVRKRRAQSVDEIVNNVMRKHSRRSK